MATPIDEFDVPFLSLDPAQRAKSDMPPDPESWVFRTEMGYMVSHHDDAIALLRDRRWHTAALPVLATRDEGFQNWLAERQPNLLQMNGHEHQRLRRVIGPSLTPARIAEFRPRMRAVIDPLIAAAVERPQCDFVAEVGEPYATDVAFDFVGASADWGERFRSLTGSRQVTMASPPDEIIEVSTGFDRLVDELLDAVESPRPRSLLDVVRNAEAAGDIARAESTMLIVSVIGGATASALAQLGSAAVLFSRFDDQYQALRERPELAPDAVEEVLRFQGAARGTARIAQEAVEYRDVLFPEGTRVIVSFVGANRDPAVYDTPDRFEIARSDRTPHLSFGHGFHFCVGAALARAELDEAVCSLADQVERIEVTGEIEWKPPLADFWGPAVLPVRLHPAEQ